jgi:hypothetical protein
MVNIDTVMYMANRCLQETIYYFSYLPNHSLFNFLFSFEYDLSFYEFFLSKLSFDIVFPSVYDMAKYVSDTRHRSLSCCFS